MLAWRLFLGPILILALVGLFALDAHFGPMAPVLWVLACLLTWRSTWEMTQLLRVRFEPDFRLVVYAALAIVSANWIVPLTVAGNAVAPIAESLGPTMLTFALATMALFV